MTVAPRRSLDSRHSDSSWAQRARTISPGASLPAASRWIKASPEGVGMLGLLYGANTVGAVMGCLLAGFYLLRVFDMATATFVAAAINVTVGLVSFSLAKRAPEHTSADDAKPAIAAGARLA